MDHQELRQRLATLTTAHLADACVRARIPVRCAPAPLRAVVPGSRLAGRVAPARHVGSVDVFLEALEGTAPGDVLVVDNGGRLDEACVGDLVALEAQAAETIRDTERGQAERMRAGVSLRRQVGFGTYLARRQQAPSLTFREHLRAVSGAIEE